MMSKTCAHTKDTDIRTNRKTDGQTDGDTDIQIDNQAKKQNKNEQTNKKQTINNSVTQLIRHVFGMVNATSKYSVRSARVYMIDVRHIGHQTAPPISGWNDVTVDEYVLRTDEDIYADEAEVMKKGQLKSSARRVAQYDVVDHVRYFELSTSSVVGS